MENRKFRFHILALAHLPCSRTYNSCAFTMKVYKMCQMLKSLGHTVILYGAENSDASICDEFVEVLPLKLIRKVYGNGNNLFEIGYDWQKHFFRNDFNKPHNEATITFFKNAIDGINKRKREDDFLLITMGAYQKQVSEATKLFLTCEPGVGYRGSWCRFKAFESASLQNFTYGSDRPRQCINGNYYDVVIPNYFDPDNFEYRQKKDDYFLFIGRLIKRKGIITAHLVTKELEVKLKIAGQGAKSWNGSRLVGEDFTIEGENLEYVGHANLEKRRELYSHAKGVFVPTEYLEAFGGVAVEAQMSGTPVITTDFGVFPETVLHGITGYRCHTLSQFVWAARNIEKIRPTACRDWALKNFSMDKVKFMFEEWFNSLYEVYESATRPNTKGWHRIDKNRKNIDWLIKYYPK